MSLVLNIYDFLVQSAAKLRIFTGNSNIHPVILLFCPSESPNSNSDTLFLLFSKKIATITPLSCYLDVKRVAEKRCSKSFGERCAL